MFLTLTLLTGCMLPVETDHERYDFVDPFDQLVLSNDTGDVTVLAIAAPTGAVDAELEWRTTRPIVEARVTSGVLRVDGKCPNVLHHCTVQLDVELPEATVVDLEAGTGSVVLTGPLGDVDVTTGTGNLDLDRVWGDLVASTGTGQVSGTDLQSAFAVVDTGTGDIDLRFSAAPERVEADTGTGDIDLVVPAGEYDIQADTGTGNVDIFGVTNVPGAARTIRVSTGTGNIRIDAG